MVVRLALSVYLPANAEKAPLFGASTVKGPAGAWSAGTSPFCDSAVTRLLRPSAAEATATTSPSVAQGRPVGSSTLSMTCATPL